MSATYFDAEAARVAAEMPNGVRLAVIGSASFWHPESEWTCTQVGQLLGDLADLVLLTGGVSGAGDTVGRGYVTRCRALDRAPTVFHILPHGFPGRDYGTILFAGRDMGERREVLGRLAPIYLVVEGGPGTAHEADVATAHGAHLLPIGRSGGHAGALYPTLTPPRWASERSWRTLGDADATPPAVAEAVLDLVTGLIRLGV